jgi:DNA-directed RNA polymerase specialized sigma24 family protein
MMGSRFYRSMPETTESPIAQQFECIAAVEELCKDDWRLGRLRSYARFLVFGLRGALQYAEADDLLHEAIIRTLEGKRKWKVWVVGFDGHLRGCMRSIADQYATEAARYTKDSLPDLPVEDPPYRDHRMRMAIFDEARSRLTGEAIALAVLNHLLDGLTPAEVQAVLNIDVDLYNAARAKISRRLHRIFSDYKLSPKNLDALLDEENLDA